MTDGLWGSPITSRDLAVYVSFVAPLVIGRLAQADAVMIQERQTIEKVARYFRSRVPPTKAKLYRGWLVKPMFLLGSSTPRERAVRLLHSQHKDLPRGEFLSFSTKKGVACFFGDPHTEMSRVITSRVPGLRGYLMEYQDPDSGVVLWTYQWRKMPIGDQKVDFVELLRHTDYAFDAPVVDRNLREQFEVVTKTLPKSAKVTLEPIEGADCPPTWELDLEYGD
jgi:hypothetical protein